MTLTLDTHFGRELTKRINARIAELTGILVQGQQKEQYESVCGQIVGLQQAMTLAEQTIEDIEKT